MISEKTRTSLGTAVTLSMLGLLAGCIFPKPETATIAAAPKTPASKTFTSFTPALRCMDDLMVEYGKRDIRITSTGILDSTGKVKVGTKEMLISALNKMSMKSQAFSFVDYDQETVQTFNDFKRLAVSYYIRGAISNLDDNTLSTQAGASIATPWADLGLSKDQIVSLVSVDMNVGDAQTRQILAYAGSSNTMAVVRTGIEGEAGGKIGKAGIDINVSWDSAEGLGSAVRALVELGAIESMGQFTHVPYWKCLQIEKTNPKMLETARDWFDSMKPNEQVEFVQRKLAGDGRYSGPISGQVDPATRDAISAYQSSHNLIANGRVDFDLYYSMLDDNTRLVAGLENKPAPRPEPVAEVQPTVIPISFSSDHGDAPVYGGREILDAQLKVGGNAFVYCYYQDADGTIARLFPNRFAPQPYVTSGSVSLSALHQPVKIRFDKPGHERIQCLASARDVTFALPKNLQAEDLKEIPGLGTLDQVAAVYRNADPAVSEKRLEITVR
jgi:peptidoglycan hydrolase-like protein with peptidoglycan-binding domain